MASSQGLSDDSFNSHKSVDFFKNPRKFSISDEMKKQCLEILFYNKSKKTILPPKGIYSTWTSYWVRNKMISFHLYTLLRVKRWHLTDENFIFDPLKKCCSNVELTPANTLWCSFPGNCQTQLESELSLDGILRVNLDAQVKESLQNLDFMLEPLGDVGQANHVTNAYEAVTLFRKLDANKHCARGTFYNEYTKLVQSLTHALMRDTSASKGKKVPGKVYRKAFQAFINCVKACMGGPIDEEVHCDDDVDGFLTEKIIEEVRISSGMARQPTLEISSKPDLFLFHRTNPLPGQPRTILAVVKAKGMLKDLPLDSDDEDTFDSDATEDICRGKPLLDTVEEKEGDSDEDDDDGNSNDIQETELEVLISEAPDWLKSARDMDQHAQLAIKRFLPQLLGDMWCAARSKQMCPLKSKNGLLFGMGLVGFEVYFVTVLDSCRDSPESVINSDSACTHVFVTRPLHLLVKEDRRIIMKTLAGCFNLHDSLYYIDR